MYKNVQYRLDWVDVARGIGIILVVLGHTTLPFEFRKWIYSFHMPLFFFLSGYFYKTGKYGFYELVIKRLKTLIVPFISFIIVNWIGFNVLSFFGEKKYDIINVLINGPKDPIWFLTTLFVVDIFHYLLDRCVSKIQKVEFQYSIWCLICFFLLLLNYLFVNMVNLHIPYEMVYVPHYLFFYIVGRAHWIDVKPNNKLWMIIVLFVVDILLEHSLPYGVGMSASFYEYALSYIVALLGIYITINISCKFSSSDYPFVRKCKSILVFYGFNSIVVLGLHTVFVRSIKCIFSSVGIVSIWSFPVRQIILWLLLALAIISINKWVPWAIGKNNDTRSKKY